jgi:peptide/nickel transport system substrate-binding protein
VRRALSRAVNRDEIVSRVFRGFGRPAVDPVWPLFWAYSESRDRYEFDPASARHDLQQAGVAGAKQTRLAFKCLFYGEDPQVERMALMIQRQFAVVGVELELEAAPLNEILKRIRSGDFESFLLQSASGRALDWTYRFWHSPQSGQPALQPTGYAGADQALDELRLAFTDEQVRTGVMKLRRQFYDDPPAVFVAWQQATRVVSNRFDISNADTHDAFANVWQWKLRVGDR